MESHYFLAGEVIFAEGEEGGNAFILKKGKVKITKKALDDTPRTVATVGPGNIIGEMALIDDSPRGASAVALEEGEAIFVTKEEFQSRLNKSDKVIGLLLKTYTDRLRQQAQQIAELTT